MKYRGSKGSVTIAKKIYRRTKTIFEAID